MIKRRGLYSAVWMLLLAVSFVQPDYGKDANDWKNRQYTLDCGKAYNKPIKVYVRNGHGKGPSDNEYNGYELYVQAVTQSQDLTGDGKPETAVLLGCSPSPSNISIQEIQVFTNGSRLLSRSPTWNVKGIPARFDPHEFFIRDGKLVTGGGYFDFAAGDSYASGPSIHKILTWRWNGQSFEIEKSVKAK